VTRLAGQRCLVLGGGSGIGRAVALAYVEQGAQVTVVERSPDLAAVAFSDVSPAPRVVVGDATEPRVIAEAVDIARAGGALDNVTCCVGVFDYYASLRTMRPDQVRAVASEVWRVNVGSVLDAAVAGWPHLSVSGGSLTLTLSESAFYPVGGGALYGSSKWALRGLVAHLAADFAPEVRVNGVAPGGTSGTGFGNTAEATPADEAARNERIALSTLLGRTPEPRDHAGAFVYLADRDAARVVTGMIVNTDGGRSFGPPPGHTT
jgi:phthalate 3,4-cis-dihydrodiol dehydrogenase